VSTGLSSTESPGPRRQGVRRTAARPGRVRERWGAGVRAAADVGPLVAFRASALRGRSRAVAASALALVGVLTVVAAWAPAYLPGAGDSTPGPTGFDARETLVLLPSAYLVVLVVSIVSAASAGGGRELLPRDQGVAFPVSPTTDHLGALLMAPLNIAWLLQGWAVLAGTAFSLGPGARGPGNLAAAQLPVLLWLLVATSVAQLVAWGVEWLRRTRHGVWAVRGVVLVLVAGMAVLIVTHRLVPVLDRSPTLQVLLAALHGSEGRWGPWLARVVVLVLLAVVAVVAGSVVAHVIARRQPRDEARVESATYAHRPDPTSDLAALVRTDRAAVWRSVPLRRGFAFLALMPGLVAVASALEWYMLNVLPGLVASGGALLFGVNAWCLDARGSLWRDSLPVRPRLAFVARTLVLAEVLLVATAIALLLGALRAGAPTAVEGVAVACSALVVTLQVVGGSMRWSVRRPYAMDLRSARATPAPPLTMVGYSSRLALVTTVTGMLFVAASRSPSWQWPVLLAVPFLGVSLYRLVRVARAWEEPEVRSRVVTTVAG
jgi:hypothetical protein